jgi:hypothetical protein
MRASSCAPPRPPHPALHVRDDRDTPLRPRRDGGVHSADFSKRPSDIFLRDGMDRNSRRAPVGQISGAVKALRLMSRYVRRRAGSGYGIDDARAVLVISLSGKIALQKGSPQVYPLGCNCMSRTFRLNIKYLSQMSRTK